jgi:ATP-dependent DNA helicase RecG
MNLQDKLEQHFRLTLDQKRGLKKIGIEKVADLLRYYPRDYGDTSKAVSINRISKGDNVTIYGKISNLETSKGFRSKVTMAKAQLKDTTGTIGLVWFNQPYIVKMVRDGVNVRVEGKVSERKDGPASSAGRLYLSNPKVEEIADIPEIAGESLFAANERYSDAPATLYPVYPETRFITSNWIYHHVQKIFRSGVLDTITDPLPQDILDKYSLPSLKTALIWLHAPRKENDFKAARKRFAFEEVFLIQLQKQIERKELSRLKSVKIPDAPTKAKEFIARLPFPLTGAQSKAIDTISKEMHKGSPLSRLLEGDVGSGKTAVAAATAYAVVKSHPDGKDFGNLQVAYMAPTEILASQHFESFISLFNPPAGGLPIEMALITGSSCKKFPSKVNPGGTTDISKTQMLKWIAEGKISVVIGTHALIQKKVKFKNLAYVVIDEQHRFGVSQRQKLARKDGVIPHLLSMTATPIPRTLALTIYGDLDLSILDEMPKGRKPIVTDIILSTKRDEVYEKMRDELKAGRQAYVICPRIDLPDMPQQSWQAGEPGYQQLVGLQMKSVKEEAKRLKEKVFPEFAIGIMHSKMTPNEKDKVMREFSLGNIDILVSTSVVEVGVNVPNATLIAIEGAERFGLAQLHQLRGRVLRGNHQAYCFVFADTKSDKSIERLKAFKTAKNGFELSELDLTQRGAGELGGGKQWGVSDIAMEALRNIKMVEAARAEAKAIADTDTNLKHYPMLKRVLEDKKIHHFE